MRGLGHSFAPLRAACAFAPLRAAAAGLALAVAAFTASASAQTGKVWRHGIIEAKSDSGILFMAGRRGFAEKLGLKLEYVELKTDVLGLKALISGDLDSFEGGPQGALIAAARGADARIVGCHWLTVPHGIFVRKEINAIEDLKGKAIAVSTPGTMPELLARGALEAHGIAPSSVKFASLGGDLDRYKALSAGVVQGAVVSAEYTPIAEKEGLKLLVPGREALPNFLRICHHMTAKTIAERPDDAVKFMAAEMQALRYALSHKDETVALTREITGAKPDDPRPAFIFDFAVETKAVDPTLPIPLDRLEWLQNTLVSIGSLNKPGDMAKIVDQTVRAKALELTAKAGG